MSYFKTETNGKGKTRQDGRATYKAKSRALRRAFGKTECLEGAVEREAQVDEVTQNDCSLDLEASYGDPDSHHSDDYLWWMELQEAG